MTRQLKTMALVSEMDGFIHSVKHLWGWPHECATWAAAQGSMLWRCPSLDECPTVPTWKFLILFKQRAPCPHFALGFVNRAVCPIHKLIWPVVLSTVRVRCWPSWGTQWYPKHAVFVEWAYHLRKEMRHVQGPWENAAEYNNSIKEACSSEDDGKIISSWENLKCLMNGVSFELGLSNRFFSAYFSEGK